ncbi:hypothetical protein CEQ90_16445 [Lewinellaceae bacterium SD302]|nr:hypothetical protein CEQ90_16445 [Lewinellaceae bacterium SD302]
MKLKNISSMAELREQRKKLAVEERIAIDGVKQNFRTEKNQLTGRVKAEINQVRHLFDDGVDGIQSLLQAGTEGVQSLFAEPEATPAAEAGIAAEKTAKFWESWKLPVLGSIAGLFAAIVTFWLTGEDEHEEETDETAESYRPTEADEFGELPEQPDDEEESIYGDFERDLTMEQRIHAALASYDEDRQEKNQENVLLAIASMIVPVLLRELLNGSLLSDIKRVFNSVQGDDNPIQDISNNIADELEKVKASVLAQEEA